MSNRNEYNEIVSEDDASNLEAAIEYFMLARAAVGKPVTKEEARAKVLALIESD